jgi:8-oxo-dGTP pyrophosphatase MutT (NUDIX family)
MASDALAVNVLASTTNQPFCAGVILCHEDCVLVTLNTDSLPAALMGSALRVGGVGGGQEAGETIKMCALREAQEELGIAAVHLIHAPLTYVHDLDTAELSPKPCADDLAPFLLERKRSLSPDIPYRPGLPTGPYVYFGLFFARAEEPIEHPGDDVKGLLWLPLAHWRLVEQQASLEEVLSQ